VFTTKDKEMGYNYNTLNVGITNIKMKNDDYRQKLARLAQLWNCSSAKVIRILIDTTYDKEEKRIAALLRLTGKKMLPLLLALILSAAPAFAATVTTCPNNDTRYCFRCLGTSSIFACCPDAASATGYRCLSASCEDPTDVNCQANLVCEDCSPAKTQVIELQAQVDDLTAQVSELTLLAYCGNGQLCRDHWNACKVTLQQSQGSYQACAISYFLLWYAFEHAVKK
jgi:hypothetical protein